MASPVALVKRHEAGEFDRSELMRQLLTANYTRGRYPPGTYDAYIPGTLDELALLVVEEKLSRAEFEQILDALDAQA